MVTEKNMNQQSIDINKTTDLQSLFESARSQLSNTILGQKHLTDRLLIALLSDGHLLVEGAPGLAKTRAVKSLSELIDSEFHRIQFTPDLLPADLTGTDIYNPQQADFKFQTRSVIS